MTTVIVIGEKGNLLRQVARRRARLVAKAIRLMPPHEVVDPAIFGYDDDSREIWEIPEARDYFITFIAATTAHGIPMERWLPQTSDLLLACQAAQEGRKVTVIGTVEDTIRDGVAQVLQYRRTNLH